MKKIFTFLLIILILPLVLATDLQVEKQSSDEVLIIGIDKPAIFNLEITNQGSEDTLQFYNLMGFSMEPKGTISIKSGETKNITLKISPIGKPENRGNYILEYYIRRQNWVEQKEELLFKIIDLKEAFEVGSEEMNPDLNSLKIYIRNKVNFDFGEVTAKFSSAFFNTEEKFSLNPKQKETFDISLNKEDFEKLIAGFYTLSADIETNEQKANVEGIIKFSERDIVTTSIKNYGWVINTEVIEKSNQGNTVAESETIIKKNIISRLFTSFNPEPDSVERNGVTINYKWAREIKPGETLNIAVKTNWFLPLLVIFFIVTIVILVKQNSKTILILRKRVSFVKAKGGEFALKVSIFVQSGKHIENVKIMDRLPPLTKIYEKFGIEKPSKIDDRNKRLEWNFGRLETGETRVISYVIYSKIGVLGKFALPPAIATFEREGKIHEAESNRAFFVTEQRGKIEGE